MILHGHWTANDSSSGSRSSLGDDGRSKLDSRHKLIGHTRRRMYIHTHGGRTHVNERAQRTLRSVRFRDDHLDDATGGDPYTFTRSHRRRTRTDGWCWYSAQARARSFVHDLRVPTRGDVPTSRRERNGDGDVSAAGDGREKLWITDPTFVRENSNLSCYCLRIKSQSGSIVSEKLWSTNRFTKTGLLTVSIKLFIHIFHLFLSYKPFLTFSEINYFKLIKHELRFQGNFQ